MNVKKKDKRINLFISLFVKYKNIPDVYEAFQKRKIDVSIQTLYNYKNNPEIFGIVSQRMGHATKDEGVQVLSDILRSDKPSKVAKTKMEACEKLAKISGWNEAEKVEVNLSFKGLLSELRERRATEHS